MGESFLTVFLFGLITTCLIRNTVWQPILRLDRSFPRWWAGAKYQLPFPRYVSGAPGVCEYELSVFLDHRGLR